MSPGAVAAVVAAGVFFVALAGVLALRAQRRSRRQIAELLDRLEKLEAKWTAAGDRYGIGLPIEAAGQSASPPDTSANETTPPSGDVLAGMTSHVRRLVQTTGAEGETLADQAILRIHRHLEENVAPAQIAEELYVSLRTLERGLAVALDCTPRQLIIAMKMREARRLLRSGKHRVSEVAYRLGFSDPFHFSRRFKAFYGVAPSEIRGEGSERLDLPGDLRS